MVVWVHGDVWCVGLWMWGTCGDVWCMGVWVYGDFWCVVVGVCGNLWFMGAWVCGFTAMSAVRVCGCGVCAMMSGVWVCRCVGVW